MGKDAGQVAALIDRNRDALAQSALALHAAREPQFYAQDGERARRRCREDARYHLAFLADAVACAQPLLFADYVCWARALLAGLGIEDRHLRTHLECLAQVIDAQLAPAEAAVAREYIDAGLAALPGTSARPPSELAADQPLVELARGYLDALLAGDRAAAERLILAALERGTAVRDIYLQVFQRVQREIGRRWQMNEITVAHEHYCTAATQLLMARLAARVFDAPRGGGRVLAVGVEGELHELGLRMVADFFEMQGWDSVYLGSNTPARAIRALLVERAFDVLAIGATMSFHVRRVAELIAAVRTLARAPRILVGGYPFLVAPDLWTRVGADLFGRDAAEAVECVRGAA